MQTVLRFEELSPDEQMMVWEVITKARVHLANADAWTEDGAVDEDGKQVDFLDPKARRFSLARILMRVTFFELGQGFDVDKASLFERLRYATVCKTAMLEIVMSLPAYRPDRRLAEIEAIDAWLATHPPKTN